MEAIVKIDEKGRVELPAPILDVLRVVTPGELRAQASSGKLELTLVKAPAPIQFVEENGVLVAANKVEFDAVAAVDAARAERL
jgi:hypothetical protein